MQDKQIVNNVDIEDCMYHRCRAEIDLTDHSISHVNECHYYGDICERHPNCHYKRYKSLEDILKELKPILELYANSKIGVEQEGGIYTIECKPIDILSGHIIPQDYTVKLTYDSNPAKRGLKLIGEALNE